MADRFELSCDALGPEAVLVAFRGHERISAPYLLNVFASVAAVPEHAAIVAQPATLTMQDTERTYRSGLVGHMEVVSESADRAVVRLEVRPRLWFLSLSKHSRVFTRMKVGEIIEKVLDDAGVSDRELRLQGSYEAEEHVSQYKESDLAFLCRLMEHEGLYYFFEHSEGAHKLVVTDHKSFHAPSRATALHYHPAMGGDLGADLLETFREQRRLGRKSIRLTDYNYGNPSLEIAGEGQVEGASAATSVDHGARAFTPGQAQRLADVRKEEALAGDRVFHGNGQAYHLNAGALFELDRHARLSGEYLCVELEHRGNMRVRSAELARLTGVEEELVYEARLTAIPKDVQFRPARVTPRPRVFGLERALVDGPADSDYAQLDADGRYRIKLAYDETGEAGERSSVRVRMLQPHAGSPEGWHLPLRKDTEVMVAFVNGDPDRPVIAGAVPNAETPSVVTSANHTKNVFHSGGDNTIEIEDEEGKQWIVVRSPTKDSYLHLGEPHDGTVHSPPSPTHYVQAHTDADCRFTIGGNQDIRVGGNLTEDVGDDVTEKYKTSQTSKVTGAQDTTVLGDVTENYDTGHKTTVSDLVTEIYMSGQQTDVTGGDRFELYDTNQETLVVGGATHTYDLEDMSVLGGSSLQVYLGSRTTTAAGAVSLKFPAGLTQVYGPTTWFAPSIDYTVKGPSSFFTPSYQEVVVTYKAICGNVNKVTIPRTSVWNVSIALVTAKIEQVTIKLEANGFKFEDAIIVGNLFAVKVEGDQACRLDTKGLKASRRVFTKIGV